MDSSKNPPQEEDGPKQILDEVTGEMVSKTELKKRKKQRENEKKKAEKAEKKAKEEEEKRKLKEQKEEQKGSDSELDVKEPIDEPNKYTENRKHWLQTL